MTPARTLTLVPQPTHAEQAATYAAQARQAGRECINDLLTALTLAEAAAREVGALGDAAPAGVRDRARRFADVVKDEANGILCIVERGK